MISSLAVGFGGGLDGWGVGVGVVLGVGRVNRCWSDGCVRAVLDPPFGIRTYPRKQPCGRSGVVHEFVVLCLGVK